MKKIYFLLLALGLFTGVEAQIINIPDANFKAKLLRPNQYGLYDWESGNPQPMMYPVARDINGNSIVIDQNNDGNIQQSEALDVYHLFVGRDAGLPLQFFGNNQPISNLTGIEYFTNLRSLVCSDNSLSSLSFTNNLNLISLYCDSNQLTNINISQNVNLKNFGCGGNQLTSLSFAGLNSLEILNCGGNLFTSLNFAGLNNLQELNCGYNQLTSLNINGLNNLSRLECYHNQLTSLDINGMVNLQFLNCVYNQLSSLNVSGSNLVDLRCSGNPLTNLNVNQTNSLNYLSCDNTLLTSLDVSGSNHLMSVACQNNNQLTSLNLKNGSFENGLIFSDNPNLQYICVDDIEVSGVQYWITQYGYSNCHVNSYCSFTPGGTYYTIQGNNKFDNNNNGCDVLDLGLPNLKFNITDGTNTGNLISNATGNFTIPVQAGTHTVVPVFENPTYFTVSPSTVNVTFPTQTSPFTQDFCITANSVHPDLEVALLPIIVARPGFDAKYKVVYKNKGNTTQSGTVNLAFNDAVLDFVSANPDTTTQAINNLSWDFMNLLPFETREIEVTLNVNSPMEIPAVNGGDILTYTTNIASGNTDEMPSDNTFVFNHTVVNSYDPNDKICLEGATLDPSKVGEYVHYMIRFENNGTANAQNIVVKDMIDTAKFDINSLVPMKGSHSFVTNITAGNKVEFIFENINLPFDDANNDGYAAFKIKTNPTLVNGDTFSNTASIYFDYNFPIVTNTATTTIAALSRQDFEFSNYFNVYPNPVSDVLNIATKETIEITSINIYNTLGQLVLVIPNAQKSKIVDVSSLSSGNYFIKINSDKGTSNTKFIKN